VVALSWEMRKHEGNARFDARRNGNARVRDASGVGYAATYSRRRLRTAVA
jgi:hypothetical protein